MGVFWVSGGRYVDLIRSRTLSGLLLLLLLIEASSKVPPCRPANVKVTAERFRALSHMFPNSQSLLDFTTITPRCLKLLVGAEYATLPVRIVKHYFLHDGAGCELRQAPVEGRQLGATGVSSPAHQVVRRHHHGP